VSPLNDAAPQLFHVVFDCAGAVGVGIVTGAVTGAAIEAAGSAISFFNFFAFLCFFALGSSVEGSGFDTTVSTAG
jgi:hypothetical protein